MVAFVQTQKLAHSNVMHNTAVTVLQGYIEQIKGIQYHKLLEVLDDPENTPLATKSISSLNDSENIQVDDPLYLNIENSKEVLLDLIEDENGNLDTYTMQVYVTPTAKNILSTSGREAIEFKITFRYESVFQGVASSHTRNVQFLKTSITEF